MTNENDIKEYQEFLKWKAQKEQKKTKVLKGVKANKPIVRFDVENITPDELKKASDKLNEVLAFVNRKQKSNWALANQKSFIKELDSKKYLAVTIARTTPTAEQRTSVYAGFPKTWKSRWNGQPIDRVTQ